ncbi:MAG: glycosyltransferase [Deltaproteobacteria bacterium]|nr:glycosyltransferase [Deltaproteobacteria bacterium]MBW2130829.1 glycosyltransferase [Deltaproteobacteria bacterium]MBW2304809.1 glycosyltransferase [Deltaproteobacteria bacterium]
MNILMITDNDPAGMGIAFTHAINRYTDHRCRLITTAEKYGFDYDKDIHLPDIRDDDFGEVEQLLKEADIIHFHVLRDENSHLGPLVIRDYIKGKRILHHHHGHPDFIINAQVYNEKYRKLGRRVIVSTPDLLKVAENATWVPNLVPLNDPLFLPRYDDSLPSTSVRICQSPTRKYHKHTREFKEAIDNLKKKFPGRIEPIIIELLPYKECLRIKRACHVVFDHMRGWFGIASLESLSQGKPVIAGLDDWNIRCIREFTGSDTLPWVIARNREELEDRLTELVVDAELRDQIGRSSRLFMEGCWTEQKVISLLMAIYQTL